MVYTYQPIENNNKPNFKQKKTITILKGLVRIFKYSRDFQA